VTVTSGSRQVAIGALAATAAPALVQAGRNGPRSVVLGIRPEHTYLVEGGDDADGTVAGTIEGTVRLVELLGSEQVVHVEVAGLVHHDLDIDPDQADVPAGRRIVVTTRDEHSLRIGDGVRLRLKPAHLHVFDADSGDALRV
jgi:ABC-type sugar transport system ATPase subunit